MTASRNPLTYPPSCARYTAECAEAFDMVRFTATTRNERTAAKFRFVNYWRALRLALESRGPKCPYTDDELASFATLSRQAMLLTTRDEPHGFDWLLGPRALLQPDTLRVSASRPTAIPATPPPFDLGEEAGLIARLRAAAVPTAPAPDPYAAYMERAATTSPSADEPAEPAAPAADIDASRRAAQAAIHRSRMMGLSLRDTQAYMATHAIRVDGTSTTEGE